MLPQGGEGGGFQLQVHDTRHFLLQLATIFDTQFTLTANISFIFHFSRVCYTDQAETRRFKRRPSVLLLTTERFRILVRRFRRKFKRLPPKYRRFRTNVYFFCTNVDAFQRNFVHAFHTNVDGFR